MRGAEARQLGQPTSVQGFLGDDIASALSLERSLFTTILVKWLSDLGYGKSFISSHFAIKRN
jgi:hypothetical protein